MTATWMRYAVVALLAAGLLAGPGLLVGCDDEDELDDTAPPATRGDDLEERWERAGERVREAAEETGEAAEETGRRAAEEAGEALERTGEEIEEETE